MASTQHGSLSQRCDLTQAGMVVMLLMVMVMVMVMMMMVVVTVMMMLYRAGKCCSWGGPRQSSHVNG
jgi:hypothetical protein